MAAWWLLPGRLEPVQSVRVLKQRWATVQWAFSVAHCRKKIKKNTHTQCFTSNLAVQYVVKRVKTHGPHVACRSMLYT